MFRLFKIMFHSKKLRKQHIKGIDMIYLWIRTCKQYRAFFLRKSYYEVTQLYITFCQSILDILYCCIFYETGQNFVCQCQVLVGDCIVIHFLQFFIISKIFDSISICCYTIIFHQNCPHLQLLSLSFSIQNFIIIVLLYILSSNSIKLHEQ